jgi:hypothetical protein
MNVPGANNKTNLALYGSFGNWLLSHAGVTGTVAISLAQPWHLQKDIEAVVKCRFYK